MHAAHSRQVEVAHGLLSRNDPLLPGRPLAPALEGNLEVNRELIVIAIGCGSLFLSHLNDGGFWIVKECLGLTVSQTLRTWTVVETIVGIVGLLIAYGVSLLI